MTDELVSLPTTQTAIIIDSEAILRINEEVISQKIESLFIKGLDVADKLLDSNIASLQLPIARSILSAATKLIGQDKSNQTREIRAALDQLWDEQRKLNAPPSDSAPSESHDPEEEP